MTINIDGITYHTAHEVATYFSLCYETISAQARAGILPFTQIGRQRYFILTQVSAIIMKRHHGVTKTQTKTTEEIEL